MRRLITGMLVLAMGLAGVLSPPGASAADYPQGQMVSDDPASGTPHVLNGRVYSIAQVGNTMVLGGTFSQARNDNSGTVLTRNRLLAFDVNTGQINSSFVPNPNGTVNVVLPAGDGESVYVGGSFSSIGGVSRSRLARVRVSDGAVLTSFNAGSIAGRVEDLRLTGGRLWVAGSFTSIKGQPQGALATVNPSTGAFDPYQSLAVAGVHNGGVTNVFKIDVDPAGKRLVAVGNFATLGGVANRQLFMLDITGPKAVQASFHTNFYTSTCSRSFDSVMRDLDFSPDGSFFVVTTTGAYGGSSSSCDTSARFETASTGTNIAPSWVDYTGGDTTYAVLITDSVVYTGGHARWQNNPYAGDREGPGAVSRPGIAALDPINGLPLSWNPTRTRGVGVFDFWLNSRGLWVGSDTDRIGAYKYRGRIALMPANGKTVPAVRTPRLPNGLYVGDRLGLPGSDLNRRSFDGTNVGATSPVPDGGLNWTQVRGAFMINGWLYLAWSNGSFDRRTFDGTTYGTPVPVNTHDQLVVLQTWRDDIQSATGMFYDSGRIYFTRSGSSTLSYRYFTPESDVVGAKRLTASGNVTGISFSDVRGMFTDGDTLYWAKSNGTLNRMDWAEGPLSDRPVGGTQALVSGPGVDANLWNARTLFLHQGAP